MNLYERADVGRLTHVQCDAVFRSELKEYRLGLVHLQSEWTIDPRAAAVTNTRRDTAIIEDIWGAFSKTGVVDGRPSEAYLEEHFANLDEDQRSEVVPENWTGC